MSQISQQSQAKKQHNIQLFILSFGFAIVAGCLYYIPLLLASFVISISLFFILSPLVNTFERNGYSRALGSIVSFSLFFFPFLYFSYFGIHNLQSEFANLQKKLPGYSSAIATKLDTYESKFVAESGINTSLNIRENLIYKGKKSISTLLASLPGFLGTIMWMIFLVPLLTLFFLQESQNLIRGLLSITPNQYFESSYNVTHQIIKNLGNYINAKLAAAGIVGLLTTIGLYLVSFPYALLLGLVAGVFNIIPYFGPILAFIPAVIIPLFDPSYQELMVPMLIVYGVINVLDVAIVFPLLVSKVIDLHPVFVLLSVLIGGTLGGPIGMLIAIPIAAILKITSIELLKIQG